MRIDSWEQLNPYHLVGLNPGSASPPANPIPSVERSAGPGIADRGGRPWSPDSPLFWFAAIFAATVGLAAASTSFRVGPVRASVSAGKS